MFLHIVLSSKLFLCKVARQANEGEFYIATLCFFFFSYVEMVANAKNTWILWILIEMPNFY
jgi:hypothetical protein